MLPAFFARYPDVSIELTGFGRAINLNEEGVDSAILTGELADSSMIVRRIARVPFATVAMPAYLAVRGVPRPPADLDAHACPMFAPNHEPLPWEFQDGSVSILHHPRANFRTADPEQIRAAVLADLGLAHAPVWAFSPEIAVGAVLVVLTDYAPGPLAVSAVHPAGRRLATKVRVFIDFLVETLARDPAADGARGLNRRSTASAFPACRQGRAQAA